MAALPRVLNPLTNPNGYIAAAGAVVAAAVMIDNAAHHHGVIDPAVIVAAVGAVAALLSRQVVTPVADPKNGAGIKLVPAGSVMMTYGTPMPPVIPDPIVQITPNPTGGTIGHITDSPSSTPTPKDAA
jgi:hypothetical protein